MRRTASAVSAFNTGRPATAPPPLKSVAGFNWPSLANTVYARASWTRLTEMPWPYAIVACSIGFHVFAGRNRPATSPGNPVFGAVPKPESESICHSVDGRQRQRDLRRADVRRFLDHLLDRQRAVRMRVVNRVGADRQRAGRRLDHRVRPHRAAVERRRDRERLQRRARLEHVGQRAVAHLVARDAVARVRVVRRPVREREDLAGLRVEDHEPAGFRAVAPRRRTSTRGTRGIADGRRSKARDRGPAAARGSTRRLRRSRRAG